MNIEKKRRENKTVITETMNAFKSEKYPNLAFSEVNCFGKNEKCTVTLECMNSDEKINLKKWEKIGLEIRHQTSHCFVKTQKDLRDVYLEGDFEGAVSENNRLIMIRPSPNCSGLLVHMKDKSVKWSVIENFNFPTSLNLVRNL